MHHRRQALHASRTTLMTHVAALTWGAAFIGFAVSFGPLPIGYRKPRRPDATMALSR